MTFHYFVQFEEGDDWLFWTFSRKIRYFDGTYSMILYQLDYRVNIAK